ncbi:hypothetical protein DAQ1742_02552 [Dickeya aquatica]|uniref:Uncharacterized protein n=1 Tax=Dickeya aquatica TaxID=1401087 RepID=A0A375ABK0_9GAMM|nr:hypothetical protein DAQ1742_02552 [Dickeya aquatica]
MSGDNISVGESHATKLSSVIPGNPVTVLPIFIYPVVNFNVQK